MRRFGWLLFALSSLVVLASCSEEDCPTAPSLFNGVTDLEVVDTTFTSATLGWTTPVAQGEELIYDIRYLSAAAMGGESQINEALWAVADTVDGEPEPSHPGYQESHIIGGLTSGTEYFAAIRIERVSDGELSDISNTVSFSPGTAECSSPVLGIPDNNPTGVYDTLTFPEQLVIEDIAVFINLTHTWIGDLIVELTSPAGTVVRLHNQSGLDADNIIGTYGINLTVDGPGSLNDFIGEVTQGDWTLWVSDNQGWDTGTLISWCVMVLGEAP